MGRGINKKITPELMCELRVKDRPLSGLSMSKAALELAKTYPDFAPRTIETLLVICRRATDTTFQLYVEGKISQVVIESLVRGVDRAEQEFLLEEITRRKMTVGQLDRAKAIRRKMKASWAEALGKATGEIPMIAKPGGSKDAPKTLDQLIKEITETGRQFRLKVSMAIDLLPETSIEAGRVKRSVFMKAYEIRHDVGEVYEFLDKRVKKILDEMEIHARTEAELASRRDRTGGGSYGGSQSSAGAGTGGSQEGKDPDLGEGQQVVQGPDEVVPGQGRVEPAPDAGASGR